MNYSHKICHKGVFHMLHFKMIHMCFDITYQMKADIKFTRTFVGNAITDVTSFKKYFRLKVQFYSPFSLPLI